MTDFLIATKLCDLGKELVDVDLEHAVGVFVVVMPSDRDEHRRVIRVR